MEIGKRLQKLEKTYWKSGKRQIDRLAMTVIDPMRSEIKIPRHFNVIELVIENDNLSVMILDSHKRGADFLSIFESNFHKYNPDMKDKNTKIYLLADDLQATPFDCFMYSLHMAESSYKHALSEKTTEVGKAHPDKNKIYVDTSVLPSHFYKHTQITSKKDKTGKKIPKFPERLDDVIGEELSQNPTETLGQRLKAFSIKRKNRKIHSSMEGFILEKLHSAIDFLIKRDGHTDLLTLVTTPTFLEEERQSRNLEKMPDSSRPAYGGKSAQNPTLPRALGNTTYRKGAAIGLFSSPLSSSQGSFRRGSDQFLSDLSLPEAKINPRKNQQPSSALVRPGPSSQNVPSSRSGRLSVRTSPGSLRGAAFLCLPAPHRPLTPF